MSVKFSKPAKLGVLLSGRGSNFLAIAETIRSGTLPGAEISVVISNIADAPGLRAAREMGLNAVFVESRGRQRAEHDAAMTAVLQEAGVELVILAGYMRLLSPEFIRAFPQRILNIHPSLLPAFAGLDAQAQAFDYGVKIAGCTVHFVDEELDHGVIVLQRTVAVAEDETRESLAEKILREEHVAYSEAIAQVLRGDWRIEGRKFIR